MTNKTCMGASKLACTRTYLYLYHGSIYCIHLLGYGVFSSFTNVQFGIKLRSSWKLVPSNSNFISSFYRESRGSNN